MDSVKAKFRFDAKTTFGYGGSQIKLSAVYSKEGENADFATATPSGNFEMHIADGVPAADFFAPGDEYYITITKAPKV
jgi:hypothetical protein